MGFTATLSISKAETQASLQLLRFQKLLSESKIGPATDLHSTQKQFALTITAQNAAKQPISLLIEFATLQSFLFWH